MSKQVVCNADSVVSGESTNQGVVKSVSCVDSSTIIEILWN